MGKTWKPLTAGILDIIFGIATLAACCVVIYYAAVENSANYEMIVPLLSPGFFWLIYIVYYILANTAPDAPFSLIYIIMAVPFVLLGVLAVIGGIYCIRRKLFWLSLAGSVATLICNFVPGLLATVFAAASRKEFSG